MQPSDATSCTTELLPDKDFSSGRQSSGASGRTHAGTADEGSSYELANAGLQLARKLNLFPSSLRVNPLGPPEENSATTLNSKLKRSPKRTTAAQRDERVSWIDLPENVVEKIFILLKADLIHSESERRLLNAEAGKDMGMLLGHTLSGVCQTWRRIANFVFLSDWWSVGRINHPMQCLFLTPKVFPALLRCYVERSKTTYGVRFALYQGERAIKESVKFLLAADLGRFGMRLHWTPARLDAGGCGGVRSNLLCTKYRFGVTSYARELAEQLPKKGTHSLAEIEYRTRLQGCMRPRRMRVTLPGKNILQEGLAALDRQNGQGAAPGASSEALFATRQPHKAFRCAMLYFTSLERLSATLARQGRPILLKNKTPHWNESLKCWCLNFRGRVKFASVKNFQLVDSEEPEDIVMQFGKVAADTYILDFQPAVVSAAQAFAIALSAFNKGLSPY